MDNIRFLIANNLVIKIRKIREKAKKMTINWEIYNIVICNIGKIKTVLFFKAK